MIELKPLPMEEAQAFWADKIILGAGEFNKLSAEAKTRAFAVSGIAKGDELATVFSSLQRAIDDGISYGQFKKECREIFERRGWTGKRTWRVDNIFRTNIQTAYQVGRYKQMMDVVDDRPYWMYDAVNDRRTRPTHRAMDSKVFPADHEFWNNWYPPNGFRCRCGVISYSKTQVESRGLKVEKEDITGTPLLPPGATSPVQLLPDPGFAHHPGKTVWGGVVDSVDDSWRYKSLPNLLGPSDYRRRALRNVRPGSIAEISEDMFLANSLGDDAYKAKFLEMYGRETVIKDAIGEPVILSLRSFLVNKAPGAPVEWKFHKAGHGEIIPSIREVLTSPYEIWLTPQVNKKGQVRLSKRYVGLWKTADKKRIGGLLVFEVDRGVFKGVTAFTPLKKGKADIEYVERQRQGVLLYPGRGR